MRDRSRCPSGEVSRPVGIIQIAGECDLVLRLSRHGSIFQDLNLIRGFNPFFLSLGPTGQTGGQFSVRIRGELREPVLIESLADLLPDAVMWPQFNGPMDTIGKVVFNVVF